MKPESDGRNERFHSVGWDETGRTLVLMLDLPNGGTVVQCWTPGEPVTDVRRVDAMPPPFVPRP